MIKTLIAAKPDFHKEVEGLEILEVAEFFYDTIQGEGINTGCPAAFLRLQHCTLNCVWCDTEEVWRQGNPYTFEELFFLMEEWDVHTNSLICKLQQGQHLVITGGSPLKQQWNLINFLEVFVKKYGFKPYIEIENECTLRPSLNLIPYIDCWNNSPKLANSRNTSNSRYKPEIIKYFSNLPNSWFKFVISDITNWQEIQKYFLHKGLISYSQIILMPQGATREELEKNREFVVHLAVEKNVRYCTREHIVLWDKKTGV